ncbi:uncharacterized protein [Typha angustifolia]|uniref:uncharacterized protein n=1 Tax=Typha angustifolia TaxID=59011 RepID=UPI003C2AC25D
MGEELTERDTTSPSHVRTESMGTERKDSTGETITVILPSPSKGHGKHVPRYLRASVGSCHDLCKYGIKHGFEAKKKFLLRRTSFGGKGKIPEEEHEQSGIIVHKKGIAKRPDLKLKMSKPKDDSKSEVSKQKMPPEKVFQLCDLPTDLEGGSFEGSSASKVNPLASDLGNAGPSLDEGPSIRVKLVIPSPIQEGGSSDEDKPGNTEGLLDGPSSMRNGLADAQDDDPVNLAEGSSVEPVSIKLMILPAENPAEGSQEDCVSLAPMASAETATLATAGSSEKYLNTKQKVPSVRSSMQIINTKMKTPLVVGRTAASSKEQIQVTSLKARKGEKREVSKPKIVDEKVEAVGKSKMIRQKKNVIGDPNRQKKAMSPATRTTTSDKQRVNEKKSPSGKDNIASNTTELSKSADSSKLDTTKDASSSSVSRAGRNIQEKKTTKDAVQRYIGKEKVSKLLKTSLSVKPLIKSVSSKKLRKYNERSSASPVKSERLVRRTDCGADRAKEKILHVIEPKPEKVDLIKTVKKKSYKVKSSSAPTSTSLRSMSVRGKEEHDSLLVSDKERLDKRNQTDVLKGESKGRSRRAASILPENKLPSPHKLNFRRGKVVNIPSENSGPRRLIFRPAKVASESWNAKGEGRVRSFRRRRNSMDMSTPTLEGPIVHLRHQDVQDKKDIQGLFNHVIEETASKLVETRKSKVKALVGAFETVISLQESKAVTTVAGP